MNQLYRKEACAVAWGMGCGVTDKEKPLSCDRGYKGC